MSYKGKALRLEYLEEGVYNVESAKNLSNFDIFILVDNVITKGQGAEIKVKWDSAEDFDIEDKTESITLDLAKINVEGANESYNVTIGTSSCEELSVQREIEVNTKEKLYGGVNNWYYGIYNGDLPEEGISVESLLSVDTDSYDKNSTVSKNITVDTSKLDEKGSSSGDNICYTLPVKNIKYETQTESDEVSDKDIYPIAYEAETGELFDLSERKTLIGVVASVASADEVKYYAPFITGDYIHASRAGGPAYNNLKAVLIEESGAVKGSVFNLPKVRKNSSSGKDEVVSVNAGLSLPSNKDSNDSSGNKGGTGSSSSSEATNTEDDKKDKNKFNMGVSIGGNKGKNSTSNYMLQSIQDINGDGTPDILQYGSNGMTVYESKLAYSDVTNEESRTVEFKSEATKYAGITYLSESYSDSDVKGASMSAQGGIVLTPNSSKRPSCSFSASLSGSVGGGSSYSETLTKQLKGFVDINGDGLPDYFSNGAFYYNTGDSFNKNTEAFYNQLSYLSKNENISVSNNTSLGSASSLGESLKSGVSVSGSFSNSYSAGNTTYTLMDINGDGLQDLITGYTYSNKVFTLTVKYNQGNSFGEECVLTLPKWDVDLSAFVQGEDGEIETDFIKSVPIIGKSLARKISNKDYAASNRFNGETYIEALINSIDYTSNYTAGFGGNVGVNINKSFSPIVIPITINVTVDSGAGVNGNTSITGTDVRFTDINGDGLVDHVLRVPGVCTYVKYNRMGRYGLLRCVKYPNGGECNIEYTYMGGTEKMPQSKYVMSSVTVSDGCDEKTELNHGSHSYTTTYLYEGGYYDRYVKDFYGFSKVVTNTPECDGEYVKTVTHYDNSAYYTKGGVLNVEQYKVDTFENSEVLIGQNETEYKYISTLTDGTKVNGILPERVTSKNYSLTGSGKYNGLKTEYTYDSYGNVTSLTESVISDGEVTTGDVFAQFTYKKDTGAYIVSLPESITVYEGNDTAGKLLRKRTGRYNSQGSMIELNQYYDLTGFTSHVFAYDDYGNMISFTYPKKSNDTSGAVIKYTYDKNGRFINKISQSGCNTSVYESSTEWDEIYGTKVSETDINGNSIIYTYDDWQRLRTVKTGYDSQVPAVEFIYGTFGSKYWTAVTKNKVSFDDSDSTYITTVIQTDGLNRVIRTAKTGVVYDKATKTKQKGWNVSGDIIYDAKGRVEREYQTYFDDGEDSAINVYETAVMAGTDCNEQINLTHSQYYTTKKYDALDRVVKMTLPDGSEQINEYEIDGELNIVKATDPLKNMSRQVSDVRGNIVSISKYEGTGENSLLTVDYQYNVMGEMLKATDMAQKEITVTYDLLGRRTTLESVDGGKKNYSYDECSNLLWEDNPVLRNKGQRIYYYYDGLNRLTKIDYPESTDTEYEYGTEKDKGINGAGKIIKVSDESGTIEYEYGLLGETTSEKRTLKVHNNSSMTELTQSMSYVSDYLGRMQNITYPDGEIVTYGYDDGGQVCSVHGQNEKYGFDYDYVSDIGYDEAGQRVYIKYGNGVETDYVYNPERRWLDSINTSNLSGLVIQNIGYSFDKVGNITGYENNCSKWSVKQNYTYDSLYQLISASGKTSYDQYRTGDADYTSKYKQDFTFDSCLRMTAKVSEEVTNPNQTIGSALNYSLDYEYDTNYENRLVRAGNRYYQYDDNGNVILERDGVISEEGEGQTVRYTKSEQQEGLSSVDYGWGLYQDDKKTSIKGDGYKRSYVWNERNLMTVSTDNTTTVHYLYGADGQRSNKYTTKSETLYYNTMWSIRSDANINAQTGKNIYLGETRIVTKLNSLQNGTYGQDMSGMYYYHSDHLGSATVLTDSDGDVYQRIEYTPYGECWVETEAEDLNYLPYKFTGKEMDEETGLYYYGARYMDPIYSRWLSTDPAIGDYIPGAGKGTAEEFGKLPGMGGVFNHINGNLYHYAGNNPVRYVDPDGRFEIDEENKTAIAELNDSKDMKAIEKFYKSHDDYTIYGLNKNGDGLQFKSLDGLKSYNKSHTSKKNEEKFENIISTLGNCTFIVSEIGKNAAQLGEISNSFGKISAALGVVSTGIDVKQMYDNPSYSNAIDVLIDATGFIPGAGPYISVSLAETKKGVSFASMQLAKYNEYMETSLLNNFSSFLFGVRLK